MITPEQAIVFMRGIKAQYNNKDLDEACDLAIELITKYKKSFKYKLKKYKESRRLNEQN